MNESEKKWLEDCLDEQRPHFLSPFLGSFLLIASF
jgi:hypothetical protein